MEVSRLLGPAFDRVKTGPRFWRWLVWLGALIALCRRLTLIFRGKLVEVSRISIVACRPWPAFITEQMLAQLPKPDRPSRRLSGASG